MSAGMLRGFRAAAAAFAALVLAAACGGSDDAAPPSIADLYAPPDAGMVAWVDAEQAAAYVNEWLDALPDDLFEDFSLKEAIGEVFDQAAEESGVDFSGLSVVMAFANADLDGGAVVLEGALADDFLQSFRDATGDAPFEEKTHRGVEMVETPGDDLGVGPLAAAVVWEGGDDGDGPELHIIGNPDEVRAAIDRRADLREGVAADGDGEADGPAHQALREVGGGWMRFAMAVPDGAFDDLTDMLPDEYGDVFAGFAGIDAGAVSGLTRVGFAANRDDDGGERWTLRLEYANAGDAERAENLAEGWIAVSKATAPEGASLEVWNAMEVARDGTVVTVVSFATAEQLETLRTESVEALLDQTGILGTGL